MLSSKVRAIALLNSLMSPTKNTTHLSAADLTVAGRRPLIARTRTAWSWALIVLTCSLTACQQQPAADSSSPARSAASPADTPTQVASSTPDEAHQATDASELAASPTELSNDDSPTADSESTDDLLDKLLGDQDLSNATAKRNHRDLYVPSKSRVIPPWLGSRRIEQLATRDQFDVFHDFHFVNRQPESGIDWESTIVTDAGKTYIAAHYDHGNGIAIADVDADGLYDMYLTSQIGANALYRNRGGGRFENITKTAGVALADRISVTASFADVDNDGDADLFVTTVRGGNALFRNDGTGRFTDVTAEAGLDYIGHSSAAVFFDYDRDGWLDLFVTNVGKYTVEEQGEGGFYRSLRGAFSGHLRPELTETSILYRNLKGQRFADVTQATGLIDDSWSGAATPIDVNQDGWVDLYTLDMQGHDEYFENVQGQTFRKRSREIFPRTPWGAMGVKAFDYDNDGRMDLYVTDMHSDMSENVGPEKEKQKADMKWPESMLQSNGQSIWGNALFHQLPDGTFEEVSDAMNAENYWPWGLSVGDLNADGFDDVFIASSMNLPLRYGINSLLLNNRGKRFLDSEFILGIEPRREGHFAKPWFELDCDGPDRDHDYAKQAGITSGRVTVWSALGSRSSVIFDFDNDGDLDIVANEFNSPPLVFESNLTDRRKLNFLKVKLHGTTSNRDGLGARVEVTAGDRTYLKVYDGQSGYLSQSRHLLYFGLDEATRVSTVQVTWPSGIKQTVTDPSLNGVLTIREEQGSER